MWEVINKKRRRSVEINKEIKTKEWDGYFMEILGGMEERIRWRKRGG